MSNPAQQRKLAQKNSPTPSSPTLSDSTAISALNIVSAATIATNYNPSEWEKEAYYHGVSINPPELLYRSDYAHNPFPHPVGRFQHTPTKTAHGVFNTPLNPVWDTVAPCIRDMLKARKIHYSAIHAVRFVTHGEDGQESLGPVVIWIAVHPRSTTADDAHLASTEILHLLQANKVHGTVVEWFEGVVEKLSGPALLPVAWYTDPTYDVQRFLTAALGMPIATAEREEEDAQGSVAFFFRENKDNMGNDSARILGVSNAHVLRQDTSIPYQFGGGGAPRQHVRLAGHRRFQRGLDEIKTAITNRRVRADTLTKILEAKQTNPTCGREKVANDLTKLKNDIAELEAFLKDVSSQWGNIASRNIGHVDWAAEISVDIAGRSYTKDLGTFEVDAERFRANFQGNIVDLGNKFTPAELIKKLYPHDNSKFPEVNQLKINGCITRERLLNPDTVDTNGEPCIIVMKDGNTTDLTVGRYAGLEAYTSSELGVESIELAIYNYDAQSGPFSDKGDSGSLVFDGQGKMVGILHSGMRKSESSHVTYATPAWWVIEQLKAQYPHANFNCDSF